MQPIVDAIYRRYRYDQEIDYRKTCVPLLLGKRRAGSRKNSRSVGEWRIVNLRREEMTMRSTVSCWSFVLAVLLWTSQLFGQGNTLEPPVTKLTPRWLATDQDLQFTPVTSVAFSPDGKYLVVGSDGVRLWDIATNKPTDLQQRAPGVKLSGGVGSSNCSNIVFSPSGRLLAWTDISSQVSVWDMTRQARQVQIKDAGAPIFITDGQNEQVVTSRPKALSSEVVSWNARTGFQGDSFTVPFTWRITRDGRMGLVPLDNDLKSILLLTDLRAKDGKPRRLPWRDDTSDNTTASFLQTDIKMIKLVAAVPNIAKTYDLATGARLKVFKLRPGPSMAFALSDDGKHLGRFSMHEFSIYHTDSGHELQRFQIVGDGPPSFSVPARIATPTTCFSPDGKRLAVCWCGDAVGILDLTAQGPTTSPPPDNSTNPDPTQNPLPPKPTVGTTPVNTSGGTPASSTLPGGGGNGWIWLLLLLILLAIGGVIAFLMLRPQQRSRR
jgi:WD40 repeat protein